MASGKKVGARVFGSITLVAKVGTRPFANLAREGVDEAQDDDILGGLLTEVAQAILVGTLSL